jgi:hypothetical protein
VLPARRRSTRRRELRPRGSLSRLCSSPLLQRTVHLPVRKSNDLMDSSVLAINELHEGSRMLLRESMKLPAGAWRLCLKEVPCSAKLRVCRHAAAGGSIERDSGSPPSSTNKPANPSCSGAPPLAGSSLFSSQSSLRTATSARPASVGLPGKPFVICDRYCSLRASAPTRSYTRCARWRTERSARTSSWRPWSPSR